MAHIEALQFTPEYKMWQYTDKIEKDHQKLLDEQIILFTAEQKRLVYQEKVPSLLTLKNFKKSPLMKNQYMKDMTNGHDRASVAILMAMLAHEQYPEFKQQMESFFGMS